jgi:ABC-2 type transport system permease protein
MKRPYSQFRAMLAIVKASLTAQFKSPMGLVFSFIFPLFFILIFGSSRNGIPVVRVALHPKCDTSIQNPVYNAFKSNKSILIKSGDSAGLMDDLLKGRITAIVNVQKNPPGSLNQYTVTAQSSKASQERMGILRAVLQGTISFFDENDTARKNYPSLAKLTAPKPIGDRDYEAIDFVLPGQLGFSLLTSGLFGVAFFFFNLRDTLVLKRLNATPLKRPFIILGEALARIIYQLIIVSAIILLGKYMFGFTLVKGAQTFVELLLVSFIGLLTFMGIGFIISGIAKSINSIPVFTNLLGFPQFMLSGTFFPYENLPGFLHPVCKALPLTHLTTALRKISFEGLPLTSCLPEIGVLGIWIVVLYAIAFKVFKWE